MWSVLIADDEPFVREGLKTLIEWQQLGFSLDGIFNDGKELLDAIPALNPDVVILDIQMPVISGLEAAKIIHQEWPEILVIILTAYAKFQYAKEAIEYRVKNYIVKNNLLEDLPKELMEIAKELQERKNELEEFEGNLKTVENIEEIESEDENKTADLISHIEDYIEANYRYKISLEQIADSVFVNRCYLSRMYKEKTKENLFDVINKRRIKEAKAYIKKGNKKIYEIAELVGLGDTAYFSRVFKKYTGYSPTEYAKIIEQEGIDNDEE